MQKACIPDGIEFAFLDSGAPEKSITYQTLVIVHGHTFHAQNFSRLMPLASKYNLRIIAVNRRDYVGSTPFTTAELEDLLGDDDAKHRQFLQARGLEIARFLVWVIDELKIPPHTKAVIDGVSKSYGGLGLMGWSLGNIQTISFLGHLKTYPRDVVAKLRVFFRTLFIYDSHYALFGYPHPEGYYHPLDDPECVEGMMGTWLASYFTHPYYALSPSEQANSRSLSALELRTPKVHSILPTNERIPPDELRASRDTAPSERSERAFFQTVKLSTVYDVFADAVLLDVDTEEDAAESPTPALPEVRIVSMYCAQSYWSTQWGAWENEADINKWKAAGRRTIPYELVRVAGANHFLHYDKPEEFLRIVANKI